jgi:hypothetical protein
MATAALNAVLEKLIHCFLFTGLLQKVRDPTRKN